MSTTSGCFIRTRMQFAFAYLALALFAVQGCSSGNDEQTKNLMQSAEKGSAEAQYDLGSTYNKGGGGLAKDPAKAFTWFEKAAMQGHFKAQCELARIYNNGLGVQADPAKAVAWFIIAANQDPRGSAIAEECGVKEVLLTKPEMEKAIAYSKEWTREIRKSGWGPSPAERIQMAGAAFREMFVKQASFVPVEITVSFKDDWSNRVEQFKFGKAEFRNGAMTVTEDGFSFVDGVECRLDEKDVYRFSNGEWRLVAEQ